MPDCFHVIHALVQGYSLAIGQRLHHAQKQLEAAEHVLARHLARTSGMPASSPAEAAVVARRTEMHRWEEGHRSSRQHLEAFSLTRHPFTLHDSLPQTSAQVHTGLPAAIDAIAL